MAHHIDNENLEFLPTPPKGHFWDVKYSEKYRGKPLMVHLREAFRPGTPVGESIGHDFSAANEKSMVDVANNILAATADRKKFIGTYGVRPE